MRKSGPALLCALVAGLCAAPASAATFTFFDTGAPQVFTVPPNTARIRVVAIGAPGGNGAGGALGGRGAAVTTEYTVLPGEQLRIFVGQRGANGAQCCDGAFGLGGLGGEGGDEAHGGGGGGFTLVESVYPG